MTENQKCNAAAETAGEQLHLLLAAANNFCFELQKGKEKRPAAEPAVGDKKKKKVSTAKSGV
jgi:hypothetical protein